MNFQLVKKRIETAVHLGLPKFSHAIIKNN